ncbi:MAG: thiamine pyrophosphate-dependent enzyme [Bacteroidota bacterium]
MSKVKTQTIAGLEISEILSDYKLAVASREASLIGRKEVFMGKAKFGIFGDGKEIPQIALSKVFKNGDFRSGYYRDQTLMFAIEELTIQEYFAQLYAHTSLEAEPASAGRLMNGHFATRLLDEEGHWKDLMSMKNSSSDVSPTAAQMPRLLGLAYASKLYRSLDDLKSFDTFSHNGNEIAFGTIGNASTSEGLFFETFNAAGVLQVPMVVSVWDDEYGISVPQEYHTTKKSISEALKGFKRDKQLKGFEVLSVNGWDYVKLLETYRKAEKLAREEHIPVLVHVKEVTQPQGHSTSGSHERYKSEERLQWEKDYDCNKKMREWIISEGFSTEVELGEIEKQAKEEAKLARKSAWNSFVNDNKEDQRDLLSILEEIKKNSSQNSRIEEIISDLKKEPNAIKLDSIKAAKRTLRVIRDERFEAKSSLKSWLEETNEKNYDRFNSHLHSQSDSKALSIQELKPEYDKDSKLVDGREVLQACFDNALNTDPRVFAIGEDVGKIGDVNQAFAGLQEKYGEIRVSDTGIREASIIGQGIGAALRGLRPITEIQYLDYLLYALQILSDDLACLQYRTKGGQKAPLIIRTRGHRLEGVWHSGSPMGVILNSLRGIHVLVPRDMTKAAGFYNTILASDEPALIIECLNGYRLKEKLPENIGDVRTPLGIPELIREGQDVTVITYGSMCRVVQAAATDLEELGISCEIIDVQSLLPFDVNHTIVESIKKTNRVVFADEDVPGGASAFMMQKVLEEQSAYKWLDSKPITIAAKEHRPAYSSDGDYFSKPNPEEVFDKIYDLMSEVEPNKYPELY